MKTQTKNRLFVLLIFSACMLPIAASFFVYYVWHPAKFMNYGELLETRQLPANSFQTMDGKDYQLQAGGKWTLLVLDSGKCTAECQQRLYDVRQIWRSFEPSQDRLQHVWAISDGVKPDAELLKQHAGMPVVQATTALINFFPQPSVGRIYLIDAQGNQVLRYMPHPEPKRMIKDIARLLLVKKM